MKFISTTFLFFFGLLSITQLIATNAQSITCGGGSKKKQGSPLCPEFDPKPDDPPLDLDDKYGVRCCSPDQFYASRNRNNHKCQIWAASKDPDHKCFKSGNYEDAKAFCARSGEGVRLCTCEEVENKCTKGTGCKLNTELIWCD